MAGLDIFEFARTGEQASGDYPLDVLPRIIAEVAKDAPADRGVFQWSLRGGVQTEAGMHSVAGRQRLLVELKVQGSLWLQCQRCLQPYKQSVNIDAVLEVVESEEEAEAAPLEDDEVDVIVGSRDFEVRALVEDELLLALPLSPRHEQCDPAQESKAQEMAKPSPFAVLAALKKS